MTAKRQREVKDLSVLANEIRNANEESTAEVVKRAKYIKDQLNAMNEEQLTRFEFFIRSHLSRHKVKEIMSNALGPKANVSDDMAIVVGGLAKLFVGELMEIAITVMKERESREGKTSQSDGITCDHITEAFRRLSKDGKIGRLPDHAFLFNSSSMVDADVTGIFNESDDDDSDISSESADNNF